MAEALFPVIGLPISLLALAIGALILWDLVAAYRNDGGPDVMARRHGAVSWLLAQARLGEPMRPTSKAVMWSRLLTVWGLGGSMFVYWVATVSG